MIKRLLFLIIPCLLMEYMNSEHKGDLSAHNTSSVDAVHAKLTESEINPVYSGAGQIVKKKDYDKIGTKKSTIRSINGNIIKMKELDVFIRHQMDSLEIPGLSFAYISNGEVTFTRNLGVTHTETLNAVDDGTLFDAASISKTVFSFFAMQMVDKGLLDLNTPLHTYLENPDIAYDERYKKITARMALSHTTGFPNWRFLNDHGNYDPAGKLRIDFEPGTQYQYSGEGYQYLAQVIAHILDTDLNGLQEIMKEELFNPLDMGESSFVWNDYLENNRAHGHINGLPNAGYSKNSNDPNFNAASSLQTNASSYGNFLVALINRKLLSESTYDEMLSIQSERMETKHKVGVQYGFGVIIGSTPDGTIYAHSGNNESATSQFLFNDEHKSGYVFFTNMENDRKRIFDTNLKKFLAKNI